jgi:hypothetical protein
MTSREQEFNFQTRDFTNQIKALKLEIEQVCNQLAQRTVLYSAHERRWVETFQLNANMSGTLKQDTIDLRTSLERVESQNDQLLQNKLDLELLNNELNEKNLRLSLERDELSNGNKLLEQQNRKLQDDKLLLSTMVERMKNYDITNFESNLARDVEILRNEQNLRDKDYQRRITEFQQTIDLDAHKIELLQALVSQLQSSEPQNQTIDSFVESAVKPNSIQGFVDQQLEQFISIFISIYRTFRENPNFINLCQKNSVLGDDIYALLGFLDCLASFIRRHLDSNSLKLDILPIPDKLTTLYLTDDVYDQTNEENLLIQIQQLKSDLESKTQDISRLNLRG